MEAQRIGSFGLRPQSYLGEELEMMIDCFRLYPLDLSEKTGPMTNQQCLLEEKK